MQTKTIKVRCSYVLDVEVPAEWDEHTTQFMIEENSCPYTGVVAVALDVFIDDHRHKSTCWACAAGGKNEIISQ